MNGREYAPLGKVMDRMARERNVRGPYAAATYIEKQTGEEMPGATMSKNWYGSRPSPRTLQLFVQAFGLSDREVNELTWVNSFQRAAAA